VLQLQPKLAGWQQQKFQLILVTSDDANALKSFFKQHPMPVKVLLDPQGEVFSKYNIQYIPSDYLINEKGVIEKSFVGWDANRSSELEEWLSN